MGQNGLANSQLTFIQSKPVRNVLTASTDAQGRFRFTGFSEKDTSIVTLQARRTGGGSNVVIRPDVGPPTKGAPLPPLPPPLPVVTDYLRQSRQQQVQERNNLPPDAILRNVQLSDVAVVGQKVLVPRDDMRRLYGAVANTSIDFTQMPAAQSGMSLLQILQSRVAGLAVSGNPPNMTVQIRNSGSPMFILDGQQTDIDFINTLPSNDIELVEVFKGPEATIFGAGANGGVIAIYTKRGDRNYKGDDRNNGPSPGLLVVRLPGYYQAREFYQPRYGAPVLNAPASDPRRITLYWDPQLHTGPDGQTEFLFHTADGTGNFQISAEGISLNGDPGRGAVTVPVVSRR